MNRKTVLALLAGAALSVRRRVQRRRQHEHKRQRQPRGQRPVATATPAPTVNANANTVNWNMNREDFNKNANNYRAKAKNAGESIGESIEDGWIHFKVRAALAAVDDLRDSTINVDVDKNVVTLRGSVANADQKAKAEEGCARSTASRA
jgi:osmotically-inducible protein OsmY